MQKIGAWYIGWPSQGYDVLAYKTALFHELEIFFKKFPEQEKLDSLLLERGASLCDERWVLDTLGILNNRLIFDSNAELSLEVGRPLTCITRKTLDAWKSMGINRVTIALPAFEHRSFLESVLGVFATTGIDIAVGCAGCRISRRVELEALLALPIKHVSVYFGSCEEHIQVLEEAEIADSYVRLTEMLEGAGFERYTLYDFARPGYRSKTLLAYAQQSFYWGFGISASSYVGQERFCNADSLKDYYGLVGTGVLPQMQRELVTEEQLQRERLRNELASLNGVAKAAIVSDGGARAQFLELLLEKGLLAPVGAHHVRLTAAGVLVEQEIVTKLW